jgi:hypothetical protein
MKLEIRGVENAGELQRERVVLRAKSDTDIGNYAVFMGRAAEDDGAFLSGDVPAVFWFLNKEIKAGDLVILYSKGGTPSSKISESGRTSYFYYWGYSQPQWTKAKALALVETSSWKFGKPFK